MLVFHKCCVLLILCFVICRFYLVLGITNEELGSKCRYSLPLSFISNWLGDHCHSLYNDSPQLCGKQVHVQCLFLFPIVLGIDLMDDAEGLNARIKSFTLKVKVLLPPRFIAMETWTSSEQFPNGVRMAVFLHQWLVSCRASKALTEQSQNGWVYTYRLLIRIQ